MRTWGRGSFKEATQGPFEWFIALRKPGDLPITPSPTSRVLRPADIMRGFRGYTLCGPLSRATNPFQTVNVTDPSKPHNITHLILFQLDSRAYTALFTPPLEARKTEACRAPFDVHSPSVCAANILPAALPRDGDATRKPRNVRPTIRHEGTLQIKWTRRILGFVKIMYDCFKNWGYVYDHRVNGHFT